MTRRLHFFPKGGPWLASSRYRVFHLAEELEKLGHRCVLHDPPRILRRYLAWRLGHKPTIAEIARIRMKETLRNTRALAGIREGEIIFAQRSVYSRTFAATLLAMRGGKKLIFDVDDAVYEAQGEITRSLMRESDLVVAGSHELQEYARAAGAREIYLFPTSVPLMGYPLKPDTLRDGPPVIGWMGTGPEHLENIKLLRNPLIELARKFQFLFLLVGSLDDPTLLSLLDTFDGVRMEVRASVDWTDPAAVAAALHRFDIGLMPLTDTPRHRAKCAFKAIESMACGIPVVLSRVGENVHLVDDGRDGFLAGTDADWFDRLATLLADAKLRGDMGRSAREKIERSYDHRKNTAAFDAQILSAMA